MLCYYSVTWRTTKDINYNKVHYICKKKTNNLQKIHPGKCEHQSYSPKSVICSISGINFGLFVPCLYLILINKSHYLLQIKCIEFVIDFLICVRDKTNFYLT